MTRARLGSRLLLTAALALPGAAAAQEPPAIPPDTLVATPADTLSPQEALRERQRTRLLRLARPPGEDTLGLAAFDTLPPPGSPQQAGRDGAAAPVVVSDSVVQSLLQALPGYDAIEYQGQSAFFDAATGELFLYGDTLARPTVRYQGQTLSADSVIHFREPSETVEACCATTYVPADGDPLQSERLIVNTRTQEASAFGAETEYTQGARWKVFGDLPRVASETVFGSHARFTSCELEVPHYHFETDELKIVRGSILVARPVRLYFGDVPVAWLPFVAQSLAQGRASGLLTPRFSVNDIVRTSGGYSRRLSNVGFYWAMSDYTDATVALDWFSGNFTSLTGGLSYRWLRQFLSGSVNGRVYWRESGSRTFSVDANHQWEISERTRMNASVAYARADFVRQYSFNPLELTQEIRSQGGFSHRFDWGHLSLSGNRAQSISDSRVTATLPNASLSLNSITLFPAPGGRGSWFNNMTWSGGARFDRQLQSYEQPADSFSFQLADRTTTNASASQSLSLGNVSFSQGVSFRHGAIYDVPRDSLPFFGALMSSADARRLGSLPALRQAAEPVDVVPQATVDWNASVGYQQTLIGSTTLTPSVSLSGQLMRSDTIELAQDFISAPTRLTFGANLRSDIYGFFPGVGAFEAIRHKVSPSISYDWSPEVTPTDLQRQVLGSVAAQPRSLIRLGISQTFEAKRRAPEEPAPTADSLGAAPAPDSLEASFPNEEGELGPPAGPGLVPGGLGGLEAEDGPTRREQGQVVNLLALRTSALDYDFVEADSAGDFLLGFRTTTLRNEISSDYLRGLTLSFEHDIFDDSTFTADDGSFERKRSFDPHLSGVNLAFSLSGRSAIFRWLGLGGDPSQVDVSRPEPAGPLDPAARSPTDETSIIPGGSVREPAVRDGRSAGQRGEWDASFSYSLLRPRPSGFINNGQQQLQIAFRMSPTESWDMSWRTSYDLEANRFNDHMVTLTRDLHRWQANFDFYKTATGNWAFRFEVSLIDNQDLKFDYQQRNLESPGGPLRR